MRLFDEIRNDNSELWTTIVDSDKLKLKYHRVEGQSAHTFYGEKIIQAPMINFKSVLLEFQLYKHWLPNCYDSAVLSQVSEFRKLTYCLNKCPWPWKNRFFICNATGMQIPNKKAFLVMMETVPSDKWLNGYQIKRDDSLVESTVETITLTLEMLDANTVKMSQIICIDSHILLPDWLINTFTKKVLQQWLEQVELRAV